MSIDQSDAPRPRWRINFEISVRRRRRWEVFGTYSAAERELALAEAKKLEKDGSDGAKVTKETYNLNTGQVETAVIYRSPALEQEMIELAADCPRSDAAAPPANQAKTPPAASKPDPAPHSAPASRAPAKPGPAPDDTLLRALPWILIALVIAALVGGGLTIGASYGLHYAVAKGAAMTDQSRIAILVGVFVIVTGTVLFAQLRRIMRRFGLARSVESGVAQESAPPPAADLGADDAAEPQASAEPGPPIPEPAPAVPPLALHQANAFEAAVSAGLAGLGSLDTGQRFATNVYIGGAIDHLAGSHDLDSQGCRDLLTSTLLRFGTPPEIAARLPDLLEGYLGQPQVRALYEAGAAHMAGHLAGRPVDTAACLNDWESARV